MTMSCIVFHIYSSDGEYQTISGVTTDQNLLRKQSENGSRKTGVTTLNIEPYSTRENGYLELFNGKLGDELLNREIIDTL